MAKYYYVDIEIYRIGERINPKIDKIITIQFQKIDIMTGKPDGDLIILKEWESSEEEIVRDFYNRFYSNESNIWNFIPLRFGLHFEFEFLIAKFENLLGKKFTSRDIYYSRPYLDLKPIIVLINDGNFRGARLDSFTDKLGDGSVIKTYYENKQFDEIEKYIKNETDAFLKQIFQKVISNIHCLGIKRVS